jgi:hypothetical protein
MSSYIENYGFTKTSIMNNNKKIDNEVKWEGNYDGKLANINIDINDNGKKEFVSMQLTNNDLLDLLSLPQVEVPLEKRLYNDFLSRPMVIEGAMYKKKHRKTHRRRKNNRKRRTLRL